VASQMTKALQRNHSLDSSGRDKEIRITGKNTKYLKHQLLHAYIY
jgi:hypothetical protein